MARRIIFIGVHNKPGMQPLDSKTKSGKLIDRVIASVPKGETVMKTNLYNVDHLPSEQSVSFLNLLKNKWIETVAPTSDDVIILLGHKVKDGIAFFITGVHCQYHFAHHPASVRSHKAMDAYVMRLTAFIKNAIGEVMESE